MEYKDYYKILGVSKNASPDEIKKQYRKLARRYHPDVSREANAEAKFKEIQEAYTVLKDPEKRKTYDHVGQYSAGQGPGEGFYRSTQGAGPEAFQFKYGEGFGGGGFSDFFEQLFGGARRSRPKGYSANSTRGQDQHAKVKITLEEAYHGAVQLLTLTEPVLDAHGRVQHRQKRLKVKIPAGITDGQQIRLAKQGAAGAQGGTPGDLYLEVHIQPHSLYTVKGRDVFIHLPITPWEAALGCAVAVPTLGGQVKLKITKGAQGGQKLRLKGRGLPGTTPGDEYVILNIYVPKPTTTEQERLYEQMATQMPFNPRKHLE
jgi:curved DNA-binding protein